MNESPQDRRSLHRRTSRLVALLLLIGVLGFAACDKVQEIVDSQTGQGEVITDPEAPTTDDPQTPNSVDPPVDPPTDPVIPEPVKPVEPVKPEVNPQEVIDRFLNTDPKSMNNGLLAEVAALESGLEQITELNLNRSYVTDAGLVHVEKLPALKRVDLTLCKITAQGLAPIASHPGIESLVLSETLVRDPGVDQIVGMTQLKELDLNKCRVTDVGVAKLSSLVNLETLILNNNESVTGAAFADIAEKCKALRVLGVNRTSFAPKGFAMLKGTGIEELQATNCQASNMSMYELRHCDELTKLSLSYNPDVTDIGVMKLLPALSKRITDLSLAGTGGGAGLDKNAFNALARCKKLKTLDLSSTSPPKGYVEHLRTLLKETEIIWDGK